MGVRLRSWGWICFCASALLTAISIIAVSLVNSQSPFGDTLSIFCGIYSFRQQRVCVWLGILCSWQSTDSPTSSYGHLQLLYFAALLGKRISPE